MKKFISTVALTLCMAVVTLAGGDKVQLKVEGMTCGGCAAGVEKAVNALEGVTESDVKFETALASIAFDNEKVSTEQIIAAIEEAGYKAHVATEADLKASTKGGKRSSCCAGKSKSSCGGKKAKTEEL